MMNKKKIYLFIFVLVLFTIDRVSKILILKNFLNNSSSEIYINSFLNLEPGTDTFFKPRICPFLILVIISPIGSVIFIFPPYQLAFVIPGIFPLEANFLSAILDILNFL